MGPSRGEFYDFGVEKVGDTVDMINTYSARIIASYEHDYNVEHVPLYLVDKFGAEFILFLMAIEIGNIPRFLVSNDWPYQN